MGHNYIAGAEWVITEVWLNIVRNTETFICFSNQRVIRQHGRYMYVGKTLRKIFHLFRPWNTCMR